MTQAAEDKAPITWKVFVLLSIIFPMFLLLLCEGVFRLLLFAGAFQYENKNSVQLEMPSWMVPGTTKPKTFSKQEIEWMANFQSGNGFRVHLVPSQTFSFVDTFSWKEGAKPRFTVKSNNHGFRGDDFSLKKQPDTIRIVAFGDSSTFGWGVSDDETYLARLLAEIRKHYPQHDFELINFAMPGDSSEFGKLIFDTYIDQLSPDLAIFGFGANDARLATLPHRKAVSFFQKQGTLQRVRSMLLRNSRLIQAISTFLSTLSENSEGSVSLPGEKGPAVSIKEYRENLRYFHRRSAQAGASAIFFVAACTPPSYQKAMRKVAEKQGAMYIPAQVLLRQSIPEIQAGRVQHPQLETIQRDYGPLLGRHPVLHVTSDACHPNALGHEIIERNLASSAISKITLMSRAKY